MRIASTLLAEVLAHARREAPNECCGVIGVRPDEPASAVALRPARNKAASPLRFEIDPGEVLQIHLELEREGLELGGIYHSHTRTAAYPSQTDISFAQGWPGVEWLIVSLAGSEPEVRSFAIEAATVKEVGVELVGDEALQKGG